MDRLRAKEPVKDPKKWSKGTVIETNSDGKVLVKNREEVDVKVTPEILKLFKSRIDGEVEGSDAWYIKK